MGGVEKTALMRASSVGEASNTPRYAALHFHAVTNFRPWLKA